MAMMATPYGLGGDQEAACLKMDLVNGWLFGIDSTRIKDVTVREKVILYQRECYGVLFRHFYKGAKHTSDPLVIEDHEETANPENSKVRLVTECRQTFGVKASGQLWFQLGLPTVPAMIEQSRQFDLLDFNAIKTKAEASAASAA